jgi:hypothetical protein
MLKYPKGAQLIYVTHDNYTFFYVSIRLLQFSHINYICYLYMLKVFDFLILYHLYLNFHSNIFYNSTYVVTFFVTYKITYIVTINVTI